MNPYEILGLDKTATHDQVRSAYRRKAASAHPDAGGTEEAFTLLAEAHRILSDPDERAHYDATGQSKPRDMTEVQAVELIAHTLNALLEQGFSVDRDDFVHLLRGSIEQVRAHHLMLRKKNEVEKARAEKIHARLNRSAGAPVLEGILLNRLARVDEIAQKLAGHIAVANLALERLENYTYDVEKAPAFSLRVGGTTSS